MIQIASNESTENAIYFHLCIFIVYLVCALLAFIAHGIKCDRVKLCQIFQFVRTVNIEFLTKKKKKTQI